MLLIANNKWGGGGGRRVVLGWVGVVKATQNLLLSITEKYYMSTISIKSSCLKLVEDISSSHI